MLRSITLRFEFRFARGEDDAVTESDRGVVQLFGRKSLHDAERGVDVSIPVKAESIRGSERGTVRTASRALAESASRSSEICATSFCTARSCGSSLAQAEEGAIETVRVSLLPEELRDSARHSNPRPAPGRDLRVVSIDRVLTGSAISFFFAQSEVFGGGPPMPNLSLFCPPLKGRRPACFFGAGAGSRSSFAGGGHGAGVGGG